jgi:hypothetical protein
MKAVLFINPQRRTFLLNNFPKLVNEIKQEHGITIKNRYAGNIENELFIRREYELIKRFYNACSDKCFPAEKRNVL